MSIAQAETAPSADDGHAPSPARRRWPRRADRPPKSETGPSVLLTRLGHIALWLLVACGAGAGVASLTLHANTAAATAPAAPPTPTTPAEGFAELYVAAYLGRAGHGTEDAIAAFYPATVALADVTPGAVWVARTAAVTAEEESPGYWAVTVAADVLTAGEDGWNPATLRYYTVGVAEVGGALTATGLPSQVAAPPAADDAPEPAVAAVASAGDEPVVEAADGFLAAYLTGDGELDRYLAPDVDLRPVDPPPFAEVEITKVGTEPFAAGQTLLRAEVTVTDEAGLVQVLEYSMDVVERDGRVEVAALHPAPPLVEPDDT